MNNQKRWATMADSTEQLPEPMTPADCDLRGFKFMPMEVQRVLRSTTWREAGDSERAAMTALWWESWHEVPAGSLPNNDRTLATLADVKAPWKKVREQALRGFVLCSDGRLYHGTVSEKALEAWIEKLLAQASGGAGNAKRWGLEWDAQALLGKLQDAIVRLQRLNPASEALKKKAVQQAMAGSLPGSAPDRKRGGDGESGGMPGGSPPDDPNRSPPESGAGRKGQGQGQGQHRDLGGANAPPLRPTPGGDGIDPGEAHPSAEQRDAAEPEAPTPPPEPTPAPTPVPAPPSPGPTQPPLLAMLGPVPPAPPAPTRRRPPPPPAPTSAAWEAYRAAYAARYDVEPVRNQTVNGQLAQLVVRVGTEVAPRLAAWYVQRGDRHDRFIGQQCHPVGLLLKQCETLATHMAREQAGHGVLASLPNRQEAQERRNRDVVERMLEKERRNA